MAYRVTLLNPHTGTQETLLAHGSVAEIERHYQSDTRVLLRIENQSEGRRKKGQATVALSVCQELKVLLEAGLNVVEAIETLATRRDASWLGQVYQALRQGLQHGQSLAQAMQTVPNTFPEFLIASMQASEQSGNIIPALARFIVYQERLDELRNRLWSAALYPMIVLGVAALVVLFLIGYVIPRFSVVFGDMLERLPLLTRGLLALGLHLSQHALWWASGVGLSIFALLALWRQTAVRQAVLNWLTERRLIKENLLQYALARLYRTLGMLTEAGIPLIAALKMCTSLLLENQRARFTNSIGQIENGQAIAASFAQSELTDTITARILQAGERAGDIASAFHHMAQFVEQKLTYRVERLAKILEPTIMLIVGSLIGLIVVLMYAPIFELANAIQ